MTARLEIGNALCRLGSVFYAQGRYEQAGTYYAEGLEIFQEINAQAHAGGAHERLGYVSLRRQYWQEARTPFAKKLAFWQGGDQYFAVKGSLPGLTGLAGVAEGQGRLERAARLLGATETLQAGWSTTVSQYEYERIMASVRRALGEEAFERAFACGQAMTLEQAIAYGLEDIEDDNAYPGTEYIRDAQIQRSQNFNSTMLSS